MSVIAEAFVRIRPDVTAFGTEVRTGIAASLAGVRGQMTAAAASVAPLVSAGGAAAASMGTIEIAAARAAGVTVASTRQMASGLLVVEGEALKTATAVSAIGPAAARSGGLAASASASTAGLLGGLGGLKGALGSLKMAGPIVGITSAAALGSIALKEIISGAADLQTELNSLAVVTGATDAEMKRISDTAEALGADLALPSVNAGDAARSMNELAKAGLSVDQTIGAAKGTLQLATAAEIGFADAAAIAGGALNVFGLQGDQAVHVADLLAGASIAAQGSMGDMAAALQQAGAVSRQAGLTIEQTVGAIALLAKNGILGSDAGTSLRTTLLRLIPTTKEAMEYTNALGIEFDENATLGEQLPGLIEQYRLALNKLTPALQQQALTQIFGSDAIRAASIFAREGSAGLNEMVRESDRLGAAAEISGAKAKGLTGAWEGLKSQLQTTAVEVGQVVIPGLEEVVRVLADGVASVNDFIGTLKKINDWRPPDWMFEVPEFFGGEAVDPFAEVRKNNDEDDFGLNEGLFGVFADGAIAEFDRIKDAAVGLGIIEAPIVVPPLEIDFNSVTSIATAMKQKVADGLDLDSALKEKLSIVKATGGRMGQAVGEKYVDGVADGITEQASAAVVAARAALARVVRQGQEQVQAAVAGAQQSLSSIGSTLAGQAAAAIDAGPITRKVNAIRAQLETAGRADQRQRLNTAITEAQTNLDEALRRAPIEREIARLQKGLDDANRSDERRDIGRTLREAQTALQDAQAQAQTAGPMTDVQREWRARFLTPFKEDVADAKGEVSKFNTETTIETLGAKLAGTTDSITANIQKMRGEVKRARQDLIDSTKQWNAEGLIRTLEETAVRQKETVAKGIADAINEFNKGKISLPKLNREIAALLGQAGVDYRAAGGKLGSAWVSGFEASLRGLSDQARAIVAGPQIPGAGLAPSITRPGQVAADAKDAVAAARANLDAKMLEESEIQTDVLKQIRDRITPPKKTRPSVAQR